MLTALFFSIPFVIAVLLALGACLLVWSLYYKPGVAVWAIMSIFVWEAMAIFLPGLSLGLYLYPTDIVFGALAFSGALRLIGSGEFRRIPKSWGLLGGVMALSFLIGVVKFGTTAGVEFRNDFYFWSGTAYFASVPATRENLGRCARAWLWSAFLVLLVVYYRWAADAFDLDWFDPLWHAIDKSGVIFRVVDSSQSLVLGQALIFLIYAMATEGGLRKWRFLAPFLGVTVLVLQHRSVWVSTFIPILLAVFLTGKKRGKLTQNLMALCLVSAVVILPAIGGGGLSSVTSSVADSAERGSDLNKGTFGGRVTGWQELLSDWLHAGPAAYVIGNPYGSGFKRLESEGTGREIAYAPHNYFVQTLLRSGLVGLCALITTYVMALRWLRRGDGLDYPDVPVTALIALLAGQLLYFIPYSPHYEQGIILGMALSLVRERVIGWRPPTLQETK